jgi:hypothetical protein
LRDLGCVVGDAVVISVSCALKAPPNVQEEHIGTRLVTVGMVAALSVVATAALKRLLRCLSVTWDWDRKANGAKQY